MKKIIIGTFGFFLILTVNGQDFKKLDKSPMDAAYYPHNFAHDRRDGDEAIVRVIYSRPQKKGREIFGNKVVFGEIWRLGANECTEIKFYRDVKVEGQAVNAGTYSMYAIPGEKTWTLIFNKDLDKWGSYSYDKGADVLRVEIPLEMLEKEVEAFTIQFQKKDETSFYMYIAWDRTLAKAEFRH